MVEVSRKRALKVLFAVYLAVLVWIIVFKFCLPGDPPVATRNINLIPYAQSAITNGSVNVTEMILNILVFLPMGLFIGVLYPYSVLWKKLLVVAGISVVFEAVQYIFALGSTDITDVIHNTIGGALGLAMHAIVAKVCKNRARTEHAVLVIVVVGIALLGALITLLLMMNRR